MTKQEINIKISRLKTRLSGDLNRANIAILDEINELKRQLYIPIDELKKPKVCDLNQDDGDCLTCGS